MTGPGKNITARLTGWLSATILSLAAAIPSPAQIAAGGRFDLTGPRIDVHVQRGEKSLPIAMVPNLQPGDKLTIHADLPTTQSVKLILVVAFLRGSTNPPTENFFTKVNTWEKKVRSEGVVVTVPQEAQQALIFLAPETGGDYSTLRSAVTGRPGVFVRAAQDLNEASFEQARIERYLQAIRRVPQGSPAELLDHSHKLAATLNLKPNEDCFKKPADVQLTCLRQTGGQVLLDDGHGQTLASMLATGDSANLIGAVAGTPMATGGGAGVYSAYIGTVIDVVRLLSGLHTAQFQYIPAIAFPDGETLNLRLNTPPSFHNPKSVIVVALPAIQPSVAPSLRLQDPGHVSCLLQPAMVLPLEGAPLVFATGFAHDLSLHLNGGTVGGRTELPLVPDAYEGGLVLASGDDRKPLALPAEPARGSAGPAVSTPQDRAKGAAHEDETGDVQISGTLHGLWGFDSFEGVTVPLQRRTGVDWTAAPRSDLFAGRVNQLVLHATGTACASEIDLDLPGRDDLRLDWKQAHGDPATKAAPPLDVKLPLEKAAPGSVSLLVHQFGTRDVAKVAVTAYSDQVRLSGLRIHAGDTVAVLSGSGLNEVSEVKLDGTGYAPLPDQPADGKDLRLSIHSSEGTAPGKSKALKAGSSGMAEVALKDGRRLPVSFTVDAPRPALEILTRSIKSDQPGLPLSLGSESDLPLYARVTIALKSVFPARFARSEKVEVALTDGSLRTVLSLADGSLVLQDAQTALAFLLPAKAFGTSAFGPLQMRAVLDDGTAGDWTPVGTLIRTPTISAFTCVRANPHPQAAPDTSAPADTGCTITGSNLFLVGSVSADNSFTTPAAVPLGFAGDVLAVPRPADNHTLYLKLRDDPSAVITLTSSTPAAAATRHPAPAAAPINTETN